ncbi:thiolase [Cantharellus anzutake]|uniref:thiolase n=1 Tax=Cantharellus anzutake TaxID=1750568 RepID=UPI0019059C0B|nr:thiolase [Cantharellus anzutake]KAF8332781.1 thiolase [Cantharellus anzutake]
MFPRASSPFLAQANFSSPNETVIVSAVRTPVGSFQGVLKDFSAPELGTIAAKGAISAAGIKPEDVEEVYFGNVLQAGLVVLGAGMPTSTEATTINKVCASGLKSITLASQAIQLGHRDVLLVGGMESMSKVPYYVPRVNPSFGHIQATDGLLKDGLWDVYNDFHMGNCAENAAAKHGITREDQDGHAIESYKRAAKAYEAKAFEKEIVPVTIKDKKGKETVIAEDEEYKKKDGTVTAANASNLNDGASALVLTSARRAQSWELSHWHVSFVSYADAALPPIDFPLAPSISLPAAVKKAGLKLEDISVFEINEAFSAVIRAIEKILNIDPAKVNPNGGAVALGHALGSSGSRIVVTLAHELKQGEYGAAAICNGGGGSSAIVIQKL